MGGCFTSAGYGPFAIGNGLTLETRILIFQGFVALCILALHMTDVTRTATRLLQASREASEMRWRRRTQRCIVPRRGDGTGSRGDAAMISCGDERFGCGGAGDGCAWMDVDRDRADGGA